MINVFYFYLINTLFNEDAYLSIANLKIVGFTIPEIKTPIPHNAGNEFQSL